MAGIAVAVYLWPVLPFNTMQQIFFAIGHFLEATFRVLASMGWMPVTAISLLMGFGLIYWLALQGKYNRKAQKDGTLI